MSEQSVLGCGRFAEGEWADLITFEGAAPSGPLFEHAHQCALCRAELDAFTSLTAHVRRATGEQQPTRAAFVDGVLAAVQHERLRLDLGRAADPRQQRRAPRRKPGWEVGVAPEPTQHGTSATGLRGGSAPWWRMRSATIALAAAVTVFAVLGTGWWSWPWSTPNSTGEVLPGGVIVKATNGRVATVRAAGLSADAAVAAVAGSGAGAEGSGAGRTIRVTLGIQAAVSASDYGAHEDDEQGGASSQ